MSVSGRSKERPAGPSGPHRFVGPDDNRLGLALSSVHTPSLHMGPAFAITDATLRLQAGPCAVAGCGKPREDEIHRSTE
jgi:hypothetical protein